MAGRAEIYRCCDGVSRRDMLQVGFLGLGGLTLSDALRLRAWAAETGQPQARKKAVIFVELRGGPSQHETYDPKPKAPEEYRGLFNAVDTNVPGVLFSEAMPQQATVMDKLAIIRSIEHDSSSHRQGSHLTQTGYYLQDRQSRENEMPSIGSVTAHLLGPNAHGVPPYVSLHRSLRYGDAAYLGRGRNPFVVKSNPNSGNFRVRNLELVGNLTPDRLENRQQLLASLDSTRRIADTKGLSDAMDDFHHQALDMVTGKRAREAFDIGRENDKLRDRYGRSRLGQSMLLARRLVEAGVTFVTVRSGGWDYHRNLEKRLKGRIGPRYDRGITALINDLYERGLDKDVLVVAMGEFGRTPKMNNRGPRPGRDHWGSLMSVLLSGGSLPTGRVVGASNDKGEEPIESPYRPESVLELTYRHLGIDPGDEDRRQPGPSALSAGAP